jgi:hypothetical protein
MSARIADAQVQARGADGSHLLRLLVNGVNVDFVIAEFELMRLGVRIAERLEESGRNSHCRPKDRRNEEGRAQ